MVAHESDQRRRQTVLLPVGQRFERSRVRKRFVERGESLRLIAALPLQPRKIQIKLNHLAVVRAEIAVVA